MTNVEKFLVAAKKMDQLQNRIDEVVKFEKEDDVLTAFIVGRRLMNEVDELSFEMFTISKEMTKEEVEELIAVKGLDLELKYIVLNTYFAVNESRK